MNEARGARPTASLGGCSCKVLTVGCLRRVESGEEAKVAVLDRAGVFGELALMTEAPRNATCIAKTEVEVYPLTKDDFRSAFETGPSFPQQLEMISFRRQ